MPGVRLSFIAFAACQTLAMRPELRAAAVGGDSSLNEGAPVFTAHNQVFECEFTGHYDGLADGIIVTGAGSSRWNGCYDRADPREKGGMTSAFQYFHREHSGSIYSYHGTWRIAEWGNYTAYQAPGSNTVPVQGWEAGLDERTPAGLGDGPAPSTREVFVCEFTAHNDGLADGIIVTGAGSSRWNGCYERAEPRKNGGMTSAFKYMHQQHSGSIYSYQGTWRIAEWGNYTAYQAPGISSDCVPEQGWAAGLDDRTPVGLGDGPAPSVHELFQCEFTAHNDGLSDGVFVTGAGTCRWNGCYDRSEPLGNGVTSAFQYLHQEHSGSIYSYQGTWRIAEWGNYTAYQAPGISSNTVPVQGWAAGLDERTPAGLGDGPAPSTQEASCGTGCV